MTTTQIEHPTRLVPGQLLRTLKPLFVSGIKLPTDSVFMVLRVFYHPPMQSIPMGFTEVTILTDDGVVVETEWWQDIDLETLSVTDQP